MAQLVKNPPSTWETCVQSLGWDDPLEEGMAIHSSIILGASLVAQLVKNLPAMQETWVQSLGQEDPLEEGMATHSCTLAWRIPWTEGPGGVQSMGSQESDMTEQQNLLLCHLLAVGSWASQLASVCFSFLCKTSHVTRTTS